MLEVGTGVSTRECAPVGLLCVHALMPHRAAAAAVTDSLVERERSVMFSFSYSEKKRRERE